MTASLAVEAAIHGHEIPHEFSPQVLDEAAAIPLEVDAATAASRVDLRKLPLVTIDGEDAKDFDDAVYCEPNRGGFRLVVAIADVSHYVRPGTALDEEATKRATSVYFPGFVVPMLPETLSNGICSLKPAVDRLCFVCDMQVDRNGEVTQSKFYEAVMHSHARLTYTQVWNALDPAAPEEDRAAAQAFIGRQMPQVQALHQLYRILDKARQKRGAIEFETSEVRFVLGPQGEVTTAGMIVRNGRAQADRGMHDRANVEAARFLLDAKCRRRTATTTSGRRRSTPTARVPQGIQAADAAVGEGHTCRFPEAVGHDSRPAGGRAARIGGAAQPSLAVYAPDNIGTSALRFAAYAHFTSPIRAIPTCWCTARSSTRWRAAKLQTTVLEQRDGGAVAAVLGALAARRRSQRESTIATARRGWNSTSAASSTAPSAA